MVLGGSLLEEVLTARTLAVGNAHLLGTGLNAARRGHQHALATLLGGLDGACFLEADGTVRAVQAHLRPSERAAELIAEDGGTRHTSARRFSFDHEGVAVLVVSQDGPVTIYSDGARLAQLRAIGTFGASLKRLVPEKASDIETSVSQMHCRRCQKRLRVEITYVTGWTDSESEDCPVCALKDTVRARCFAIEVTPVKSWDEIRDYF